MYTLRTYLLHQLRWMERMASKYDDFSAERATEQAYGYIQGLYAGRSEEFTDEINEIWYNWRCHMLFGKEYTLPED